MRKMMSRWLWWDWVRQLLFFLCSLVTCDDEKSVFLVWVFFCLSVRRATRAWFVSSVCHPASEWQKERDSHTQYASLQQPNDQSHTHQQTVSFLHQPVTVNHRRKAAINETVSHSHRSTKQQQQQQRRRKQDSQHTNNNNISLSLWESQRESSGWWSFVSFCLFVFLHKSWRWSLSVSSSSSSSSFCVFLLFLSFSMTLCEWVSESISQIVSVREGRARWNKQSEREGNKATDCSSPAFFLFCVKERCFSSSSLCPFSFQRREQKEGLWCFC